MAKVDKLERIETQFKTVKKIEAALEPARDELERERDEVKEVLGLHSATSIKVGGLRFTRSLLIGVGIGAAGMIGLWLFTPGIAIGMVVLASAGAVAWMRGVFHG